MGLPGTAPARHWQPEFDPVCGRLIEPVPIAYDAVHAGRHFYFCSSSGAQRFKADPSRFRPAQVSSPTGARTAHRS